MDTRTTKWSRTRRAVAAIACGVAGMVALDTRNAAAENTRIVLDMPVVIASGHDAGQAKTCRFTT